MHLAEHSQLRSAVQWESVMLSVNACANFKTPKPVVVLDVFGCFTSRFPKTEHRAQTTSGIMYSLSPDESCAEFFGRTMFCAAVWAEERQSFVHVDRESFGWEDFKYENLCSAILNTQYTVHCKPCFWQLL